MSPYDKELGAKAIDTAAVQRFNDILVLVSLLP